MITLCQERHNSTTMATSPCSRPFPIFSPFQRTNGSCLACPHSAATETCFLLLEGVWPELLLQELSGKTELYVHFPMAHSPDTEKSLDWFTCRLELLHVLEYGSAASPKSLSCSQLRLPRSRAKHHGSGVSAQFWSEESLLGSAPTMPDALQ